MGYRKMNGRIRLIAVVFLSTLILGLAAFLLGNKDEKTSYKEVPEEKVLLQQKEDLPVEPSDKPVASDITVKYMTISQKGNIDITVNYLTPVSEDKDMLAFEVSIGTHSVDLTKYKDVRKYAEIRTDDRIAASEGFEWDVVNAESHHISGILKIKNNIEGSPIIGEETKSFKLIFRNIPDGSEREHLYEGEKLK